MSSKGQKRPLLEVGTRVFAKVRGYPAWPARVEEHQSGQGNGAKYKVFFYGTYESGVIKAPDLWEFNETSKNKFAKGKKPKDFMAAMKEIEDNPGIQTLEMIDSQLQAENGGEAPEGGVARAVAAAEVAAANTEGLEAPEGGDEEIAKPDEEVAEAVTAATEPEDSEGALTIDEGKQQAEKKADSAASGRGAKRKATEGEGVSPAAKVARGPSPTAAAETPSAAAPEKTSRSGRVIKSKKFADEPEQAATTTTPAKESAASGKKERKVYVHIKETSDVIELDLDHDRPVS